LPGEEECKTVKMAEVVLSDDILFLICDELRLAEDFATLFSCALAGKQLASLALSQLYR